MLNRRSFFLSPLVAAVGVNVTQPARVESNENESERPTGLAAPFSPQGASGAWPINSPDNGV
jgi:hypothetical protein